MKIVIEHKYKISWEITTFLNEGQLEETLLKLNGRMSHLKIEYVESIQDGKTIKLPNNQ